MRTPRHATVATLLAIAAALATVYLLAVLNAVPRHPDLDVYVAGARDLWHGRPLYAPFLAAGGVDPTLRHAFIYPPAFAIVLLPLLLIPATVLPGVWFGLTQVALAAAFWLVFRRLRAPAPVVLLALIATLVFYPLWVDASQSQVNLFILVMVVLGVLGVCNGDPRGAAWLGIAAALKLTPVLLLGWLLWERRFRAASWMAAGAAAVSGLALVARPGDSLAYVHDVLPALSRGSAYYSNQSIAGFLSRLFTSNPYTTPLAILPWEPALVLGATLLVFGWWLWASSRQPDPLRRALTALPVLPLVSSVSWEHHLVIVLPVLWLALTTLAGRGWPRWPTAALGLCVLCLAAIPHLPIGPPFQTPFSRAADTRNLLLILAANRLLLGTLILWLCGPWLVSDRSVRAGTKAQGPTLDRGRPPAVAA
jgi:alpha-1,2-mannosyltransferase